MYSIITRQKDNKIIGATLYFKNSGLFAQWKDEDSIGEQTTQFGNIESKTSYLTEELANEAWNKVKKEIV